MDTWKPTGNTTGNGPHRATGGRSLPDRWTTVKVFPPDNFQSFFEATESAMSVDTYVLDVDDLAVFLAQTSAAT